MLYDINIRYRASVDDLQHRVDINSVSTRNCYRQLHVRPRGVDIDPFSVGGLILELLQDKYRAKVTYQLN
jgi:hypothetical protein